MTTRLYLWGIVSPSVKPPSSSLWAAANTTSFPHARLHTTKGSSYASATASYTGAMAVGKDYKTQTWQSRPLQAQTVPSGPLVLYAQVRESTSTADLRSQVVVRATDISGQVTKAVLYSGDLSSVLSSEWLPSTVSRSFPRQAIAPVTLPSYVAAEGDRIVIELGARLLGPAGTYTASISNSDSLSAIAANETSSVLGSPWVELPGDIAFLPWVTSTYPVSWETREQIVITPSVEWDLDARIVATSSVYWYDFATITALFPINYLEYARVVSTREVTWDVAGKVVATFPAVYDVDKTVIQTVPVVYDIQATISHSFDVNWDDRTQVISTQEVQWDVGKPPPVMQFFGVNWETRNRVVATFDVAYDSYTQIINTFPIEWDSIARAVMTKGVYWYDFATVSSTFEVEWDDLVTVIAEFTVMWTDRSTIVTTAPVTWDVAESKETIVATFPVFWYTDQTVTTSFDVEWTQDNPVSIQISRTFPVSWNVAVVLPPPPPDDTDIIHITFPDDIVRLQIYPTLEGAAGC